MMLTGCFSDSYTFAFNRNMNSTAYTMATIFNEICESESDLMVDPYLNSIGAPPGA